MHKCPICDRVYKEPESLYLHIEDKHSNIIPPGYSGARYLYYLKTKKTHGNCIICKKPTTWNEKTNKYNRFCENPECKAEYRRIFQSRMIGKYGKTTLLNDPEQQKKMLANRKISGKYKMGENEITYTGSYELDFLRMLDKLMEWDPNDIMAPSPHTYWYTYKGEPHFYIPDFYIPSLNLEIEIKDGGDNPNNHHKIQAVDKEKEKLKDEVMKTSPVSYIKVVNKEYGTFFSFLKKAKENFINGKENEKIYILENSTMNEDVPSDNIVLEAFSLKELNPVYVLLTYTGTAMSKIIKFFTHQPYSHSSISLDSSMTNCLTFGRKNVEDRCKFTDENIFDGLLGQYAEQIKFSLYVTFYDNEQLEFIRKYIEEFKEDVKRHTYSYVGLINVLLNKVSNSEGMFCSQFVASVLEAGDKERIKKHNSLYTPSDLREVPYMFFVSKGLLKNYDKERVDKETIKIKERLVNKESFTAEEVWQGEYNIDNNFYKLVSETTDLNELHNMMGQVNDDVAKHYLEYMIKKAKEE